VDTIEVQRDDHEWFEQCQTSIRLPVNSFWECRSFCTGVRSPYRELCGNSWSQQVHRIEDHRFLKHDKMQPKGLNIAVTFSFNTSVTVFQIPTTHTT
jgi:hypothetical protein